MLYSKKEKLMIENRLNGERKVKYSFKKYQKILGNKIIKFLLKFEK